ncbi:hypothetical protein MTO96_037209, partial [Rhipicephalus appendiculatus]
DTGNGPSSGSGNSVWSAGNAPSDNEVEGIPGSGSPGVADRFRRPAFPGWNNPTGKKPKRCMLPPEKGYCRAFMPNYFFDYKDQLCKIFIYGGCGGNDNKFQDEKKCQEVCLPQKKVRNVSAVCPPSSAKGGRFCRHWYFDQNFGTCSRFGRHECAKNANGFSSCHACMKRCSTLKAKEVCELARQSTSKPRMQQQPTTNSSLSIPGPNPLAE